MIKSRILLIIPCYNEQSSIGPLLEEIAADDRYAAIVVDDGSDDDTYRIASRLSPTIRLLRNIGIGGAVQTGIKYAERNGYDCCVQIDGDGQHLIEEIEKLVEEHARMGHSIVVGSRYLRNDSFRSTWARRTGARVIAQTMGLLFPGGHFSDPTSGMRLMDRRAIKLFAERYPPDFPEPISLAWALEAGLSVGEVAVRMRSREHGKSSIMGFRSIAYMLRVLGYIILCKISPDTPR